MLYEAYLQLQGRAGSRQLETPPHLALTHNIGGSPDRNICSIVILGASDS
jgi:acetyl-CoA C-acetyltransferase